MADVEPITRTSSDLEGGRYLVEYHPDTAMVVMYQIVSTLAPEGVTQPPDLVARGQWSNDHIDWSVNRLGLQKAATVASVLAPHLVVRDGSIGARTSWEQRCPKCVRLGFTPPAMVHVTFGDMLDGCSTRCANGHDLPHADPDGRVARNIFLITDANARTIGTAPTPSCGTPGPFQVRKMFDRGTDSRIVRNLVLPFFATLETEAVTLDAKAVNGVKSLLLEAMRDIGHLEDAVHAYVRREEETLALLSAGGVRITPNAILYDDPTVELRKLFGDALTSGVIALRNVPRLATAILGLGFDDSKSWKKLLNTLRAAEARHDRGGTVVSVFDTWTQELYGLRGQFEHPHPPLEITPVDVVVRDAALVSVHPPRLVQPAVSLRAYLEPLVDRMVDDIAHLLWLLHSERCAPGYTLKRYDESGSAFRFAPVKLA